MTKATVIVPTTKDRGVLLPYSIGSIQNQTLTEIEIFIIGDGVTAATKNIIKRLQDRDSRIRFFDFPKHERRGEPNRHQALQEANGEIVCYLCDRDLMLPNHIETLYQLLKQYNFASTTYIDAKDDGSLNVDQYIKYVGPAKDNCQNLVQLGRISLSNVGHTLDLYQNLPFGWRSTPKNEYTDVYMWKQFMRHPGCIAFSEIDPTILYFKRGDYPGTSVIQREQELSFWFPIICDPIKLNELKHKAIKGMFEDRLNLSERQRRNILLYGYQLQDIPQQIIRKVSNFLRIF